MSAATVLLAHHIPARADQLHKLFTTAGFSVATASTANEAIKYCLGQRPNLVFTSLDLPDQDGYTLCQILRKNEVTAALPIIFVDGPAELSSVRRAMLLGADDYIPKDSSATEVLEVAAVRHKNSARFHTPGQGATTASGPVTEGQGHDRLLASFAKENHRVSFQPHDCIVGEGEEGRYIY